MGEKQERWRRPGVRLAILALVIVAFYFLAIFVRQSWNLYQLSMEVRAKEEEVAQLRQENEQLRQVLAGYQGDAGQEMLARQNLLYRNPQDGVVMPVEVGTEPGTAPAQQPAGTPQQELAAMPIWQQWLRVIFTPMVP